MRHATRAASLRRRRAHSPTPVLRRQLHGAAAHAHRRRAHAHGAGGDAARARARMRRIAALEAHRPGCISTPSVVATRAATMPRGSMVAIGIMGIVARWSSAIGRPRAAAVQTCHGAKYPRSARAGASGCQSSGFAGNGSAETPMNGRRASRRRSRRVGHWPGPQARREHFVTFRMRRGAPRGLGRRGRERAEKAALDHLNK